MVRESALFQADGGAGWGETNEHATTGRIAEQMARPEMEEEQRQNRTTERGGPRCSARAGLEYRRERVFRVAAIGVAVVSAALELLAERAHAVASC